MANQSQAEQFDALYGKVWRAFFKADAADLSQHERQLLHHVPGNEGIALGDVAQHLGIPKSSASEQVKSLERRGFLIRRRDRTDERRLAIVLTARGAARIKSDSVLDLDRLGAALRRIPAGERELLFDLLDRLARTQAASVTEERSHEHLGNGRRRGHASGQRP